MLVAFSDTHLTPRFNRKKFNYLFNLVKGADRVAILGDFWDGHRCRFDQFVRSPWRHLFPLLKSKNTIYTYGNHDLEEWCDERVNLFSTQQAPAVDLQIGTLNLHFEHGHRIAPDLLTRNPGLLEVPFIGWANSIFLEAIPMILVGDRWIRLRSKPCVQLLKERARELSAHGQWLVCGHSHVAEMDPTIKYANSGLIGVGRAQFLRIDSYSIGLVKAGY